MGHSYNFDGEIRIEPPLNYAEIQKARTAALTLLRTGWDKKNGTVENVFENYLPLSLELKTFEEATERGPLTVTEAVALKPSRSCEGSMSYAMDDVVTAIVKACPGHYWNGQVTALHDEHQTATKVSVDISKTQKPVQGIKISHGTSYVKWDDGSPDTKVSDIA